MPHELLQLGNVASVAQHIDSESVPELVEMEIDARHSIESGDKMFQSVRGQLVVSD